MSHNLSGNLSLKNTHFPCLYSHPLPVALYLWVRPCEISYIHVGMSADVIVQSCLGDYTVKVAWEQIPVIHRRHYLTADTLVLWLFQSPLPFCDVP